MNTNEKCPLCGEGHVTSHVQQIEHEYKGQKAMLASHYQKCDACLSEFAGAREGKMSKRGIMAFRKSVDCLLTGAEICALRNKYNLTQTHAAKLFGGGPVAFSKYENNDVVQSESMDTLLRLVRRSEAAFWELVAEKGMASEFVPAKHLEKIVELTTTLTAINDNVVDLAHFRGRVFRSSSSSTFTTTSDEIKQWKQ